MKDIFLGYLSKTLNLDAEQLADLLYQKSDDGNLTDELTDNALQALLAMDAERVQKIKPDTKAIFDNGYKKAQSEVAESWEGLLRQKFGVDADKQLRGEALADAIKAAMTTEGIKPDKIKTAPEYLALEVAMKKAIEDQKNEYENRIKNLESGFTREKTWAEVSAHIREAVTSLNPVLPADQAKANRLLDLFLQEFKGYEYQRDEQGGYLPLRDGQRVEDAHGYARKLSDLVKERAEQMFDFREQQPAGNAGNQNKPNANGVNVRFKSEAEYFERYAQAASSEEKAALYKAWEAQKAN